MKRCISERVFLSVAPTAAESVSAAAQRFAELAAQTIDGKRRFRVALSGGQTPRAFYQTLVRAQALNVQWSCVDFFWSDERMVLPDHPDSNYRLAQEFLLSPLHIAERQIFRVGVERGQAEQVAASYQTTVTSVLGEPPIFNLILLGLGEDGHTASLFPGSAALDNNQQWVAANWVEKLSSYRITFTLPLLNRAEHILFLAHGENKASVLADVLTARRYPAALVKPYDGWIDWYADEAAAARLIDNGRGATDF